MIQPYLVKEILDLLAKGNLSNRQIALRLKDVSRTTVNTIAKHPKKFRDRISEIENIELPKKRCPQCGYMVCMPCLACKIENAIKLKIIEKKLKRKFRTDHSWLGFKAQAS